MTYKFCICVVLVRVDPSTCCILLFKESFLKNTIRFLCFPNTIVCMVLYNNRSPDTIPPIITKPSPDQEYNPCITNYEDIVTIVKTSKCIHLAPNARPVQLFYNEWFNWMQHIEYGKRKLKWMNWFSISIFLNYLCPMPIYALLW